MAVNRIAMTIILLACGSIAGLVLASGQPLERTGGRAAVFGGSGTAWLVRTSKCPARAAAIGGVFGDIGFFLGSEVATGGVRAATGAGGRGARDTVRHV